MKFLKNKVLPIACALSIMVSLLVPVASAASGVGKDTSFDTANVEGWIEYIQNADPYFLDSFATALGTDVVGYHVFFEVVNHVIGRSVGEVELDELNRIATQLNNWFGGRSVSDLYDFVDVAATYASWTFVQCFGLPNLKFEVVEGGTAGYYRIQDTVSGLFVVNSTGRYPCTPVDGVFSEDSDSSENGHNHWVSKTSAEQNLTCAVPMTGDDLKKLCTSLQLVGEPVYIADFGSKYKAIYRDGREVYANPDGYPFVAAKDDSEWAVNQERPQTNATENGDIIEGDVNDSSTNIDLSGMTVTLPDGSINFIDKIIYDESTKSYHIDSHDTYNYTVNNYYTWNYYINYTSITYIGQTEEYNKYYEVYYELPDGRDSADLTKEELEQLNLSIDVIPYGRSADDTSLRSLYHFDGDTRDSSYWNYCTDFTWNKGASLTYMDAGVFEGALYLDETEHDFTFTLPSMLSTHDFTVQFRYYQSATAAPVTDSYVQLGSSKVLQMSGGYFSNSGGTQLATTPVGSWNEIALIRDSGTIYTYLNGVCIGSEVNTSAFDDTITFHFGDEQQTFKYFDELRVLDYALQTGGANYECTSVPHDTNLALVLPDSALPVADEYWAWDTAISPAWSQDFSTGYSGVFEDRYDFDYYRAMPAYNGGHNLVFYGSSTTTLSEYVGGVSIHVTGQNMYRPANSVGSGLAIPISARDSNGYYLDFTGYRSNTSSSINGKQYTFSVVDAEGNISALTFDVSFWEMSDTVYATADFDWGSLKYVSIYQVGNCVSYVWILPKVGETFDFVYMELVEGDTPNTGHEWVESVTILDKDDLHNPTLAVRTDLDITSYQIGGVRPSVPTKGQVWALVENERITSIQIYNGQAWEGVDGRIWTGSRWIPASSYNIVTLQDMYDIVDATPDFEYIYTESGFWTWWQKSWNAFTEKLFSLLGTGGTGGGSGATGGSGSNGLKDVDLDEDITAADPEEEDGKSLWQFIVLVIDGGKSVVSGVRHLFSGVVSTIPDTMDGITGAFDSGGVAVGLMDGTGSDPDVSVETYSSAEGEVLDPWRYR